MLLIYRFSQLIGAAVKGSCTKRRMTDGTIVKLDNGTTAQLKRVAVNGASYATLLVAVELPKERVEPRPQ